MKDRKWKQGTVPCFLSTEAEDFRGFQISPSVVDSSLFKAKSGAEL
jgi:hypothetical protein